MGEGELTEGRDHSARPVNRSDEIDHPCDEAEQEGAQRRLAGEALRAPSPPGERNEQRNQRNPRDRRMTVLGETQREQDARGQS